MEMSSPDRAIDALQARRMIEVLTLVVERLSHAMRTPLGVAIGVVNDHLGAYKLEPADYLDAQIALRNLLAMLDQVQQLRRPPNDTSKSIVVADLLSSVGEKVRGAGLRIDILPSRSTAKFVMERVSMEQALIALARYLCAVCGGSAEPPRIEIVDNISGADAKCSISARAKSSRANTELSFEKNGDPLSIVQADHGLESLDLLYCYCVCCLQGAEMLASFSKSGELVVDISL